MNELWQTAEIGRLKKLRQKAVDSEDGDAIDAYDSLISRLRKDVATELEIKFKRENRQEKMVEKRRQKAIGLRGYIIWRGMKLFLKSGEHIGLIDDFTNHCRRCAEELGLSKQPVAALLKARGTELWVSLDDTNERPMRAYVIFIYQSHKEYAMKEIGSIKTLINHMLKSSIDVLLYTEQDVFESKYVNYSTYLQCLTDGIDSFLALAKAGGSAIKKLKVEKGELQTQLIKSEAEKLELLQAGTARR